MRAGQDVASKAEILFLSFITPNPESHTHPQSPTPTPYHIYFGLSINDKQI